MTPSKSNTKSNGHFNAKYDWARLGKRLVKAYLSGGSPLTLSAKFGIPKGAIASFLGRQGVRRTKKEAKRVEREQQRGRRHPPRTCAACPDTYVPASPNQRYCRGCIPNATAHGRFTSKGVTQKAWDRILEKQDGTCALCDKPATDLDHDHKSLVVRGALCGGCNQALNRFERPGWVRRAQKYIKRDTGHRVSAQAHAKWVESMERVYARRRKAKTL